MSMPYNLGAYENGENTKYSIDVAFRDLDSDYRVNGFHENMMKLEDFIIKEGMANSKSWFAKKIKSEDVLRAPYLLLLLNVQLISQLENQMDVMLILLSLNCHFIIIMLSLKL